MNSSNSSKPPSSDGLAKPSRTISTRESNKKFGGQEGHKGKTLVQFDQPDEVIIHKVTECSCCKKSLKSVKTSEIVKRQVVEVEVRRHVIEHQGEVKTCKCGATTTATFPEDVKAPIQNGLSVKSFALYLSEQFIPKYRLSNVFKDVFGIEISDTTILKYEKACANSLKPFYTKVADHLKKSPVKHLDETGVIVNFQIVNR